MHHQPCRIRWCHIIPKALPNILVSIHHPFSSWLLWKNPPQFLADIIHRETVCQQFRNHLSVGYEVDQRDIVNLDNMIETKTKKFWQWRFIAYHLRYIEKSRFQGRRSAGDEGCCGMGEQGESVVMHHLDSTPFQIFRIIAVVYRWGASQHKLVIGKGFRRINHRWKVVLNLLLAASC